MVRKLIGAVAVAAAVQLIGISGVANAAVHNVIADEIGGPEGIAPVFTVLTDSRVGELCRADENATACFATSYEVPAGFIDSAFRRTGGAAAVDLIEGPGTDNAGLVSDNLYLTVSAVTGGHSTVTWCWDSDSEPGHILICPVPNGITPTQVVEPASGFIDLTSFFTGPNGPLSSGTGQWSIRARSEIPEPTSLALLGAGLLGFALARRRKRA